MLHFQVERAQNIQFRLTELYQNCLADPRLGMTLSPGIALLEKYLPRSCLTDKLMALDKRIAGLAFLESYFDLKGKQAKNRLARDFQNEPYFNQAIAVLGPDASLLLATHRLSSSLPVAQKECERLLAEARAERSEEYTRACRRVFAAWPRAAGLAGPSIAPEGDAIEGSLFALFVREIERVRQKFLAGETVAAVLPDMLAKALAVFRVWGFDCAIEHVLSAPTVKGGGLLPFLRTHGKKIALFSSLPSFLLGKKEAQVFGLQVYAALAPRLNECLRMSNKALASATPAAMELLKRKAIIGVRALAFLLGN